MKFTKTDRKILFAFLIGLIIGIVVGLVIGWYEALSTVPKIIDLM